MIGMLILDFDSSSYQVMYNTQNKNGGMEEVEQYEI